jgi:hypothetical protein
LRASAIKSHPTSWSPAGELAEELKKDNDSAMNPPTNPASAMLAMPTQKLRRISLPILVDFPRLPMFLPAGLREILPDPATGDETK